MTARKFLGWTFCLALVLWLINGIIIPGKELTAFSGGRVVGAALFYTAIPAIVLLLGKLFRATSATPYYTAGVLFAVGIALGLYGANLGPSPAKTAATGTYVFSPPDCEYAATFPSIPKIKPIQDPEFASVTFAVLAHNRTYLAAECTAYKIIKEPTEKHARQKMEQELRHGGYGDTATHVERRARWIEATGTGTKVSEGERFTIKVRLLLGEKTALGLVVWAPSTEFPSPAMVKFLDSGRLKR